MFFEDLGDKNELITFDLKKSLAEKTNSLTSKDAHLEIFDFLDKNDIKSTTNANGTFININNISNSIFYKLSNMVNFFFENEEKLKGSYKVHYSHSDLSESSCNNTLKKMPNKLNK
jgi:hypothetical protein